MWRLSVLAFLATAAAQIPSLGWCPDYQPMLNFNMKRMLGTWYEAERYFTVSEIVSRCVTTKYESSPEGRILVSNEITNSITGLKRVMDGHLQVIGREGEGRLIVKYAALPIPYDTEYSVLDTDYDNYAVMWSCSGIGPVHTQNAWILTRERLAPMAVLQAAYGVLDRFKISRTFFIKTPQEDCSILPNIPPNSESKSAGEVVQAEEKSAAVVPEVVAEKVVEQPVEKHVDPEVKPEVPAERSAVPAPVPVPEKPLPVPELIMAESSEKKEEKFEKPEEFKKEELPEKDMPQPEKPIESNESKESKESESKESKEEDKVMNKS